MGPGGCRTWPGGRGAVDVTLTGGGGALDECWGAPGCAGIGGRGWAGKGGKGGVGASSAAAEDESSAKAQ